MVGAGPARADLLLFPAGEIHRELGLGWPPADLSVVLDRSLGRYIPAYSGMVCREKRQIVRPTRENYGKMPGFGLSFDRLISVRFYEKT